MATNPSPPAASAIESPEDFARRVGKSLPPCDLNSAMARRAIVEAIRSRDAAVRREALAPFAWAIAEAFRCEKDIEIRVGSLTTVVTAADVRLALASGDSDG